MINKALEASRHSGRIWGIYIDGDVYYFRELTLREYGFFIRAQFLNLLRPDEIAEKVFSRVIVSKSLANELDGLTAGIVYSISNFVLSISGNPFASENDLSELDEGLDQARNSLNTNPIELMYAIIMKNLKGYTLDMLEQMKYMDVLRLFAMAEKIDQNLDSNDPISFTPQKKPDLFSQLEADSLGAKKADMAPPPGELNKKKQLLNEKQKEQKVIEAVRKKREAKARMESY